MQIIELTHAPRTGVSAATSPGEVTGGVTDEHKHVIIVGMIFYVARMPGRPGKLGRVRSSGLFDGRRETVCGAVSFLAEDAAAA